MGMSRRDFVRALKRGKSRFAAWQRRMNEAEPRGPFRDY